MLAEMLVKHSDTIRDKWFQFILETYPADSSQFMRKEKDRFLNPVGFTIQQEIRTLYQELVGDFTLEKIRGSLEKILKIRAVQDFEPSAALSLIFFVKRAIREELQTEIKEHNLYGELWKFDDRIDALALLAFDLYMQTREKIFEIKANDAKRMTYKLLERMNKIAEKKKLE